VPSSPASTYVVHLSSAYTGGTGSSSSLSTDFQWMNAFGWISSNCSNTKHLLFLLLEVKRIIKNHIQMLTPDRSSWADTWIWDMVDCVSVMSDCWGGERKLRGAGAWREPVSTGRRLHDSLQRLSNNFIAGGVVHVCCVGVNGRPSCCIPADWCRDCSSYPC